MSYKSAIAKVKQYFPNAVLSSKEIRKVIKTAWKGGDGVTQKRETIGVSHQYFVTDGGVALLDKKHWTVTKSQAWSAVAKFMQLPKEPEEVIQKSWPLQRAWVKRERNKESLRAKSKAKIARYGRVVTDKQLAVS